MGKINLMRVYDSKPPYPKHTFLVDRLWPRGISKAHLEGITWLKDIGPSNELREWFHHDPQKWPEFERKYKEELKHNPAWKPLLKLLEAGKTITLLYGSKDEIHNQAVVLKAYLKRKIA